MATVVLKNVPGNQVDQVVQDFQDAGATDVDVQPQGDGLYTITATFPDSMSTAELSMLRSKVMDYAQDVLWEAPEDWEP